MVGSLTIGLPAIILATAIALLAASRSFDRRSRLAKFLHRLLYLPVVLSPALLAGMVTEIVGTGSPIAKSILNLMDRIVSFWPASVIVVSTVAFPLVYLGVRRAFEQADANLVDSMRVLGFSGFALFRKILLPLSWRGILAGIVLGYVRALGEFAVFIMLLGRVARHPESTVALYAGWVVLTGLFISLALLVSRLPACVGKPRT